MHSPLSTQSSSAVAVLAQAFLALELRQYRAMPPKRKADQLPTACEELKAQILKDGGEISSQSIAGVERALRQRAFSSLNSVLKKEFSDKFVEYTRMQDDDDRREWLAAFLVDPKSGGSVVRNDTKRTTKTAETGAKAWLTIEEYGGPRGCNSLEHATLRCEGGEFASRPHESPLMAAKKIKQYYVPIDVQDTWEKSKTDEALLRTESKIGAEDVENVKTMMENFDSVSVAKVANKRRKKTDGQGQKFEPPDSGGGKDDKELSAEEKKQLEAELARSQAAAALADTIKKAKQQYDKMNRELGEVRTIEDRIAQKTQWGDGPLNYLKSQTAIQKQNAEELFDMWAEMKGLGKDIDIDKSNEKRTAIQAKMTSVEEAYKEYKKTCLADFGKAKVEA